MLNAGSAVVGAEMKMHRTTALESIVTMTRRSQISLSLMKRSVTLVGLLVLCLGVAIANSYRPRTLDEKVKEANLIVLGTATAYGEEHTAVKDGSFTLYERSLRVEVKEVLWPSSYQDTNAIVFRYYMEKAWPKSWWDYTNTPGVFFLTKSKRPERGQWDRLERFDDWMEHQTNAPVVRALIKMLKK